MKSLFEFDGNGLNFKLKHRKVYIQFYLWDLVTHSGDWGICAVPGRLSDNRGELAHNIMLSHNRLIIICDVGMCSYHMMKLMKMVSTLEYHANSNSSLFSFRWCNNQVTWYKDIKQYQHHSTIVNLEIVSASPRIPPLSMNLIKQLHGTYPFKQRHLKKIWTSMGQSLQCMC